MRIAIVVHNDVRKDARVLKGADTLFKSGHDVKIFGLTAEANGDNFTVGPHDIPVNLSYRSPIESDPTLLQKPPINSKYHEPLDIARYLGGKAILPEARILRSFTYQGLIIANAVINDGAYDAIHIHDHVALTATPLYKNYMNVPIIWDAHEIYEALAGTDPARGKTNAAIVSQHSSYIDAFITINESIGQFYTKKYENLPTPVIMPNASLWSDRPEYDGRLHKAAGLDLSQKILLFQGGISPHRGAETLVDAASDLPDDWSLVFMGWGNLKDDLEMKALSYDLTKTGNERVCFIDGAPQDELALWTAGASLGAIPYENIGLNHLYCTPNKLWEYPLSGVPILASDLEEMGRTLRKHGTGVLIPREFTKDDVVNAILSINDQALNTMKAACDEFAKTNNWQALEYNLTDIYQTLLDKVDNTKDKASNYNEPKITPSSPLNNNISLYNIKKLDRTAGNENMVKTILRAVKRRLFSNNAQKNQIKILNERNLLLKDKLNEVRTLYKLEVAKRHSDTDSSGLERKNALLNERVEKLKDLLHETREKLKNVRIDQRSVSPILHNTSASMNEFFDKDEAEEPYSNFGEALKKLLAEKKISLDGKNILDLGTGPGKVLANLIEGSSPASIVGHDFSEVAIEKAKSLLPDGKFKVADIYKPTRSKGDIVLCTEVLEHLEKPQVALKNIISSIAPSGLALITVPDGRVDYSLYHINFWSPESWKLFIETACGDGYEFEVGQFQVTKDSYYKNNFALILKK